MGTHRKIWLPLLGSMLTLVISFWYSDQLRLATYRGVLFHGPRALRVWAIRGLVQVGDSAIPTLWSALESALEAEHRDEELIVALNLFNKPEWAGVGYKVSDASLVRPPGPYTRERLRLLTLGLESQQASVRLICLGEVLGGSLGENMLKGCDVEVLWQDYYQCLRRALPRETDEQVLKVLVPALAYHSVEIVPPLVEHWLRCNSEVRALIVDQLHGVVSGIKDEAAALEVIVQHAGVLELLFEAVTFSRYIESEAFYFEDPRAGDWACATLAVLEPALSLGDFESAMRQGSERVRQGCLRFMRLSPTPERFHSLIPLLWQCTLGPVEPLRGRVIDDVFTVIFKAGRGRFRQGPFVSPSCETRSPVPVLRRYVATTLEIMHDPGHFFGPATRPYKPVARRLLTLSKRGVAVERLALQPEGSIVVTTGSSILVEIARLDEP